MITGEWVDRDGDEDVACADYLEALLRGQDPDPEKYAARVRNSDFGRRFRCTQSSSIVLRPARDLDLCAQPDRFDFALLASHVDGRLQLQRSCTGQYGLELRNGLQLQAPLSEQVCA